MAKDPLPHGVTYNRGFRLLGTPLGFSGTVNPGLLFYANVDQHPPSDHQRILSTPAAAVAMGASVRGLDTMGLEFNRKVRLGRMDIRLLPSGFGFGGALLEVTYKDRSIVFCGGVRLTRPLFGEPVQIPKCDLLLIDTDCADPRPPSAKTSSGNLIRWAREVIGTGVPVVACGSPTSAIETAWSLRDLGVPITASRPLFEMLRRIEPLGHRFQGLRRLNQDWPPEGLVLHFDHLWATSPFFKMAKHVAYAGPGKTPPPWATASFRMGEREDRSGLVSFARETGAPVVALGPGLDESTGSLFRKSGIRVSRLEKPEQMPLPL